MPEKHEQRRGLGTPDAVMTSTETDTHDSTLTKAEACEILIEVTRDLGRANEWIAFLDLMTTRMVGRLHKLATERDDYRRKYFALLDERRAERRAA